MKKYIASGVALNEVETPAKEGYTFSGWSKIPETMPAHDVIITGSFTKDIKKGDVNGDGAVDIADAVKIVNMVVGKVETLSRKSLEVR